MTRINVGIEPRELPDKLLLAEHREIKRIPNVIKSGRYSLAGIPDQFCLGTGHVKFFYNKLGYLHIRYGYLYRECIARGFKVQFYGSAWNELDDNASRTLFHNYIPTDRDRQLLIERITSKGFSLLSKD
jgi:hypothetical protein